MKDTLHIMKLAGLCLLLLGSLLLTTNPQTLPAVVLILPFIFVFLIVFLTILSLGSGYKVLGAKLVRIAVFGAAFSTLILILQSLGQLTLRDVLTILALTLIAYFYMTRVTRRARN